MTIDEEPRHGKTHRIDVRHLRHEVMHHIEHGTHLSVRQWAHEDLRRARKGRPNTGAPHVDANNASALHGSPPCQPGLHSRS